MPQHRTARPIELLLVDDDAELRSDLSRFFLQRGYQVAECGAAEEALERTDRQAFDVIILDMVMPGMSGLELLRQIKSRKRFRSRDVDR